MFKLLLVDDEQIIREGLSNMIDYERLNIELTASCGNALAALDSMTDDMPDILLTDIRMPGMDGLELIERAISMHPYMQMIVLSGYDTFQYAQHAIRYGVMDYLLKPCSVDELNAALEKACKTVERKRQQVSTLYEERKDRIKSIIEKLNYIRDHIVSQEPLRKQVSTLVDTTADPSLIQDAFISIVTKCGDDEMKIWGLNAVNDALQYHESLKDTIVQTLLRLHETGKVSGVGYIQQMITYAQKNYQNESLSLQYLADKVVFMNADYIGREFARIVGQKFSAYLLSIRMEHAKALILCESTLSIYEIAEQVGLGKNPHYFSQLFRKYTGVTPKDYRQNQIQH